MLEGYMTLSKNDMDNIKQYMVQKLCPYAIFVFGSAAKGHMKPDSDIDIAFLALRTSLFQMQALKEYAVLNEQRQCILDSIRERGFEYGK